MPLSKSDDYQRLIESVKRWFDAPDQVAHYAEEIGEGPGPGEAMLLGALRTPSRILDVGCGAGRISIPLASQGFDVTGVDISNDLLEVAGQSIQRKEATVHFVQVDGSSLPFPDASFDAVLAFKVYCYIPMRTERIHYLEELARVMKPGGVLLLSQYIVPDEFFDEYKDENYHRYARAWDESGSPCDRTNPDQKGELVV